jgi:hypothetical protein
MNLLDFAEAVIRDILLLVAVMTALLVGLLVAITQLPSGNALRRVLAALCLRIAAMIGAGLLAIPLEPIPGLDVAYDIAAPLGLLIFWVTFFRRAAAILKQARTVSRPSAPEARLPPAGPPPL